MNKTLLKLVIGALLSIAGIGTAGAFDENSMVWKKCAGCHAAEGGKIARVEEIRTTPEEWTVIVDRMRRLHGMRLHDGEMAALLKELSSSQMLTPAEAAPISYMNLFNNPQVMEVPQGDAEQRLFTTCVRCHSAGKIYSYRMTASAWSKLRDFHLYMDPAIMYQMREMHWRSEADAVLQYLGERFPYGQAWAPPKGKPDGEWLMLGNEPGKGAYRGHVTLVSRGDDEFSMQGKLSYSDGTSETFSGEATLYGGYALRTRARQNGSTTMGAFSLVNGTITGEHHHAAPDFRTSSSTWFPITSRRRVLRITPAYLLANEETEVLIEGVGLPEVSARDISASLPDLEVLQARTTGPETIEAVVVYRGTGHAPATLKIKGLEPSSSTLAVKLAPRIDYLSISPATGRARVNGGLNYPAEGVQFQAFAYSSGEDAEDPADDYQLGPVAATFSLAEEQTRPDDDDLVHLGAIEADGTYLPSGDYNPIPSRSYGSEGTGMVRVIAQYNRGADSYTAEARLVVTVPDFIQRIK